MSTRIYRKFIFFGFFIFSNFHRDRQGLVSLIEKLRTESDPDRKFEEPSDDESETDVEEEEKDEDIKDEPNVDESDEKIPDEVANETDKEPQPETVSHQTVPEAVEKLPVEEETLKPETETPKETSEKPKKHVDVKTKRFDKSPEFVLKKEKIVVENTPRSMKPQEFAQHIEKLKSEKILLPLLNSPLPFKDPPKSNGNESLKTKINMKFNMIKPVLQNEVLMSKIEDVKKNKDFYKKVVVKRDDNAVSNYVMQINKSKEATKIGKPGLKLEQILKSKLAQKLAANEPATDLSRPKTPTDTEPVDQNAKTDVTNEPATQTKVLEPTKAPSESLEKPTERLSPVHSEAVKRKLSAEDIQPKKPKLDVPVQSYEAPQYEDEIEEALMLVTGIGNGRDCECGNPCQDDDYDEREFVLFVTGVGSGRDCDTGNNENEETEKDKHSTLTHKVEDILSKNEVDGEQSASTSSGNTPKKLEESEKKKPKLWTIDAICNSDSKDSSKNDDISSFPNYSFNKDKKPDAPQRNEFSYFGATAETKENDIIPTNFYFGCDTQNPPYVAEVRNVNSFKTTKSHNVKDIVELDGDKDKNDVEYSASYTNSHSDEAFNLCTRGSTPPKQTIEAINFSKPSENVYNVTNLSSSIPASEVDNQNESKIANDRAITNSISSIVPYEDSDEGTDNEDVKKPEDQKAPISEPTEPVKEPENVLEPVQQDAILEPLAVENSNAEIEALEAEPIEELKPEESPPVEPSQSISEAQSPPEEIPESNTIPNEPTVDISSKSDDLLDPENHQIEPSIEEPIPTEPENPPTPPEEPQISETTKVTEQSNLPAENPPSEPQLPADSVDETLKPEPIAEECPKEPPVEKTPEPEAISVEPPPVERTPEPEATSVEPPPVEKIAEAPVTEEAIEEAPEEAREPEVVKVEEPQLLEPEKTEPEQPQPPQSSEEIIQPEPKIQEPEPLEELSEKSETDHTPPLEESKPVKVPVDTPQVAPSEPEPVPTEDIPMKASSLVEDESDPDDSTEIFAEPESSEESDQVDEPEKPVSKIEEPIVQTKPLEDQLSEPAEKITEQISTRQEKIVHEAEVISESTQPDEKPIEEEKVDNVEKTDSDENHTKEPSIDIAPETPEKKSKKGKNFDETTPLVLRTSARVTRSAKKDTPPKKDNDKKKPAKEAKSESKTITKTEPKSAKKAKGKSQPAAKSEEEPEPVKIVKKTPKGKKKPVKATKASRKYYRVPVVRFIEDL